MCTISTVMVMLASGHSILKGIIKGAARVVWMRQSTSSHESAFCHVFSMYLLWCSCTVLICHQHHDHALLVDLFLAGWRKRCLIWNLKAFLSHSCDLQLRGVYHSIPITATFEHGDSRACVLQPQPGKVLWSRSGQQDLSRILDLLGRPHRWWFGSSCSLRHYLQGEAFPLLKSWPGWGRVGLKARWAPPLPSCPKGLPVGV